MISEPIEAGDAPDVLAASDVDAVVDNANGTKQRTTGSRRRRRQAAAVVGLALVSAAAGVLVGSRLKSPSDAASQRAAPTASLITVPVEKRKLESTLTVAGEIRYVEPTPVRLAGAVGGSGDRQVVTRLPAVDAEVAEGAVLLEVSGRPVFALRGELPMYRQLVPGSTGPDVTQLETALDTLGFSPGTVDNIYDSGTEAALDAFYESHGYISEGASETQRKDLIAARKAVGDADEAVRRAKNDLATGSSTVTASERLAKQQSVERATAAVPAAESQATRDDQAAAQETATATASRNNIKAARDAEKVIYDAVVAAAAAGETNPLTSAPYTPADVATAQSELLAKEQELIQAEQTLATATANQTGVAQRGQSAVKDAQDALALALGRTQGPRQATRYNDAEGCGERRKRAGRRQPCCARRARSNGRHHRARLAKSCSCPCCRPRSPKSMPHSELSHQPSQLALVSSTNTQITGRIAKVDGDLVTVGAVVDIQVPDAGINTTGTVTDVRKPVVSTSPNDNPFGGGGGDTSDRLEVVVVADDSTQINQFIGFSVRIKVTVSATASEVLAVPVAALSVGPDGISRVEVEREAARGTRQGRD